MFAIFTLQKYPMQHSNLLQTKTSTKWYQNSVSLKGLQHQGSEFLSSNISLPNRTPSKSNRTCTSSKGTNVLLLNGHLLTNNHHLLKPQPEVSSSRNHQNLAVSKIDNHIDGQQEDRERERAT